jgi:hypothetical protein
MVVRPSAIRASRRGRALATRSACEAARVAFMVETMPPPARAISSYDAPASRSSNSWARSPPNTRWVWGSIRPGVIQRPSQSMVSRGSNAGASAAGPA